MLGRVALKQVTKLIPWVGSVAGGAYSFGVTYAIGRAACWYYGEILSGHLPNPDEVRHVLGGASSRPGPCGNRWRPAKPTPATTPPSPNEAPEVNRWVIGLVVALYALPIVVLVAAGGYALWERGWYFYLWWLLPVCWGIAVLILRSIRKKQVASVEEKMVWTPRDEAAWKIVEEEAQKAASWPEDKLAVADTYVKTVRELAVKLARHYHPDAADPVEGLTLIEIFTAIELAGRDMGELVRTSVPGSHLLTVGKFRLLSHAPKWYNWANNAVWAVSALFNPVVTIERYLASQVGMTPLVNQMRGNVIAWFYSSFVQRTGIHLIELNSGRLKVGADRWRELQEKAAQTSAPDGAHRPRITKDLPELTIALVGQVKAGKSSLVNALLGSEKAEVDVLPATDAITRYRFAPTDVAVRFTVLDTIGYAGGSDPKQALAKALKAVNQAQVVLVVLDAQMAARAADHAILAEWQNWFEKHPESRPPPLLGVMTHIDLLSPSLEWQPPYAGWLQETSKRPKEQMIREAILSIKETLQPPLAGVVPVCTAADKIYGIREFLWPAIVELLPEAHARRINEALLSEGTADRWRQLWGQIVTSGRPARPGRPGDAPAFSEDPREDEESSVMRRLLPLLTIAFASLAAPRAGARSGRARKVNFEPDSRVIAPEYAEDENSLRNQAEPIAAGVGLLGGAATGGIPLPAAAADFAGKLWGPRMNEALDEYIRQLSDEKPALLDPPPEEKSKPKLTSVRDLHRLMHERISRMPPPVLEQLSPPRRRRRAATSARRRVDAFPGAAPPTGPRLFQQRPDREGPRDPRRRRLRARPIRGGDFLVGTPRPAADPARPSDPRLSRRHA